MDDTVLYPQEEILFVGQLPYKYLVSGIRRMKTKQFTASLVVNWDLPWKEKNFELKTISNDWNIQIMTM